MTRAKLTRRPINGVLLLNKPTGISSNKALQTVKNLYHAEKAGHTGSLDPLASGMLPICLGEATKFSQYLLSSDKTYEVIAKLGVQTTTGDKEGEIVKNKPVPVLSNEVIQTLFSKFTGKLGQTPPMYSALKHKGDPLYKLARKGIEVDRPERPIEIYALKLKNFTENEIHFEVKCSKGTYIRTLAEDMGKNLGCGAHVIMLHRLDAGHFKQDQMISLKTLEQTNSHEILDSLLLPVGNMIQNLPELIISEAAHYYLMKGQSIIYPYDTPDTSLVKLVTKNKVFLGLGKVMSDDSVIPSKMLQTICYRL